MENEQTTIDEILDEMEGEDDGDETVRSKWLMDGASTLSEAATMLRDGAAALEKLEQEGWQLVKPVEDDYGFIARKVT